MRASRFQGEVTSPPRGSRQIGLPHPLPERESRLHGNLGSSVCPTWDGGLLISGSFLVSEPRTLSLSIPASREYPFLSRGPQLCSCRMSPFTGRGGRVLVSASIWPKADHVPTTLVHRSLSPREVGAIFALVVIDRETEERGHKCTASRGIEGQNSNPANSRAQDFSTGLTAPKGPRCCQRRLSNKIKGTVRCGRVPVGEKTESPSHSV